MLRRCLAALALVLWAAPASATIQIYLPLARHVSQAELVVLAKVTEVALVDEGRVRTVVRLQVTERWKGEAEDTLALQLRGGGNVVVSGEPRFSPGQEVVLFVDRLPNGRVRLEAMGQSVWTVRRDGAVAIATRDLEGLGFLQDGKVEEVDDAPVDLAILRDAVKEAAR